LEEVEVTGCDPAVLRTISKVFNIVVPNPRSPVLPASRKDLVELEGQLRRHVEEPATTSGTTSWMHAATKLHCVATLLWINRSAYSYNGSEASHQALVSKGLQILAELETCDLPWPLFVIACETRADEQRCGILGVIRRTQERSSTRHMDIVKGLIEIGWNYDDLDPAGLLSYDAKLCSIIHAGSWMPPFI
jgi:hypothetical protein